jgi:signal transduction histidine kinase/HAMP domain-containing protein
MGLRTRITVFVVVAFSAVTLGGCFYITHQVKVLELERLQTQIDKSAYLMRSINTLPLYNVDLESIKMNMETFFDDENMKSLSIHDSEVNININLKRQMPLGGTDIKKSFVIDYKGLTLGRLTVVYSTGLIEKKMAGFQTKMIAAAVLVTLAGAVVFFFLIRIITDPLAKLARSTSDIAAGDFDGDIEQTGVGEVKTLAYNFARMCNTIQKQKKEIQTAETKIEDVIRHKNRQNGNSVHHEVLTSCVNKFIKQSMTVQSIHDIAQVFIPIVQRLIPGPYCFVGQICDPENNLRILALSDEAEKECPRIEDGVLDCGFRRHISGGLVQAITSKVPVIANNLSLGSEFSLMPGKHPAIDTIMAVPVLQGKDVFGLAVFAGKEIGYTPEDQAVASMMALVLGAALNLQGREEENQRLENMMVQSERLVSAGKLAGGMANEINGPLTGIDRAVQEIFNRVNEQNTENLAAADKIGLRFEDLGRYLRDQGVVNNLNAIMSAGKKASGIVEHMLSFSGITTENSVLDDISRLLDQALELASVEYGLEQDFDFNAIQIMTDYDPDLPKVKCRPGELKQVFFHILSNGAYAMAGHTDNPCPTFFIRTYSKADQVCVEIRDNGPGMSETISTRIFEPLFSTKPDKSGAGLGLSLAYFIITENHNGAVEVESAPGEGTCFRIFLPC